MASKNRINIDIFKAVTRSIAHSEDLDVMTNHLAQLLTASLDIKGCAIFVLNAVTEELEILAGIIGLAMTYARFHNTVHAIAEVLGHTFQVELTPKLGKC
jgi:hypothetical protein